MESYSIRLRDIDEEKNYYDLRRLALRISRKILHNIDDAEDVAQIACLKYLQNIKSINQPKAWVNRTAHNAAIDFAKKRNIPIGNIEYFEYNKQNIIDNLDSSEEELDINIENLDFKEVKKLLSADEYKLYKLIIKYKNDSAKIAKKLNKPIESIYSSCHRMRKNLSAAKYLQEGFRGSTKIVNFNMHRKILAFINSLIVNMKDNNLSKMHNYFRAIDTSKIPLLGIAQTFPYNIHLLSDGSYDVYIPYKSTQGTVDCCCVDFKINKFNEIIITKFYPKTSVKIFCSGDKVMDEFKLKRKGLLVKSEKEAESFLKSSGGKQL